MAVASYNPNNATDSTISGARANMTTGAATLAAQVTRRVPLPAAAAALATAVIPALARNGVQPAMPVNDSSNGPMPKPADSAAAYNPTIRPRPAPPASKLIQASLAVKMLEPIKPEHARRANHAPRLSNRFSDSMTAMSQTKHASRKLRMPNTRTRRGASSGPTMNADEHRPRH